MLKNVNEFSELYPTTKFYKITLQRETHNGFLFETGLNIDDVQFNPTGECRPGGIYFTEFNKIPKWIDYRSDLHWIREVTFDEYSQIYIEKNCFKTDRIILGERMSISDFYKDIDEKTILKHLSINGNLLKFIENQTDEMCIIACINSGLALQYVKNQTHETCLIACTKNGYALDYVEDQTDGICFVACTKTGRALKHVKNQNDKIRLVAFNEDEYAEVYFDI